MEPFPTTEYYQHTKGRSDRSAIQTDWVLRAIRTPEHEEVQSDGRIRRWARIPEFGGRALRVILLSDGVTVHNAFFDRDFRPPVST